jgi:hypothetical protein
MNPSPMWQQRGGFGFAPMTLHYQHDRPNALAWATFALVVLLVLTVGAMLVARFAARRGGRRWHGHRHFAFAGAGPRHDPLDVLRWRYARGELGRDDFLQGVGDLTAHGGPPPPPPPE